MAPTKVIIDTDPGIDDINALLLALAASPEDIEVLLISATYGNVDVQNCLRNLVSMFHVIEKEREWRRGQGLPPGFDSLDKHKPVVAAGPTGPLGEQQRMADYFHGRDGLGGIYDTHAHLFPQADWEHLFDFPPPASDITKSAVETTQTWPERPVLFSPSKKPSHLEMLDLLSTHPPATITVIALGPLTNLALAASADPVAFQRAKEIVIMGGALYQPGNITPLAEFNIYADSIAAARVFALTSPIPGSTMPPVLKPLQEDGSTSSTHLPPYPPRSQLGPSVLNIVLVPLDTTEKHAISRGYYVEQIDELLRKGSPLAEWHAALMSSTFKKVEQLHLGHEGSNTSLALHDPLCVWWALDASKRGSSEAHGGDQGNGKTSWNLSTPTDIRVETTGQWSRGACIVDQRDRRMETEDAEEAEKLGDRTGDTDGWLTNRRGNRIRVCENTPGKDVFVEVLLGTIFGLKSPKV